MFLKIIFDLLSIIIVNIFHLISPTSVAVLLLEVLELELGPFDSHRPTCSK